MSENEFNSEVKSGERFEFGKNWQSFLNSLTTERIEVAKASLKEMIQTDDLKGKTFLDIGCGSGLFSLSAKMLDAKVHSFDFDPSSVNCARFLNEKFNKNGDDWIIEQGSVLDTEYLKSLPKFDIVYSWGVLHHTGNMKLALDNAGIPVVDNGILFIAIYDDLGTKSKIWLKIKKIYNSSSMGRFLVKAFFYPYYIIRNFLVDIFSLRNPYKRYKEHKKQRGMSMVHDWNDWLGGLPFEVATTDVIIDFYAKRGFSLKKLKPNRGGCNEFVFVKD